MDLQDCMDFAEFYAKLSQSMFEFGDIEVAESFKEDAQKWAKFALLQ